MATFNDPFIPIFEDMRRSSQQRIAFCEDVQRILLAFSSNFQSYAENLFQLNAETQASFKKRLRSESIESYANWVTSFATYSQSVDQFAKMVKVNVIGPLNEVAKNYSKQADAQFSMFLQLSKKYEQDFYAYQEKYKAYIKHCQLIEATGQKCEKAPDKFQLELDQLRDQCIGLEKETADACAVFAKYGAQYQSVAEQVMIGFENIEKNFYSTFVEIVKRFVLQLDNFKKNYSEFYANAQKEFANIKNDTGVLDIHKNNGQGFSIIDQFGEFISPNFNIFEILPPNIIFQSDLQANYMNVQQSYSIKMLSLLPGDLVKVINERPTTYRVENSLGIRGKVPRSLLKSNKAYKPVIYLLKENVKVGDLEAHAGQYVLGLSQNGQNATCKDIYGRVGQVPLSKLQLYEVAK